MKDGKLYMTKVNHDCVFAYCDRGIVSTSFYICVGSLGDIYVSDSSSIYGAAGDAPSLPADERAIRRFNTILAQNGTNGM